MTKFYFFLVILLPAVPLIAQEYPFQLPDNLTASVDIKSGTESPLSDKMLSVNIGWDSGLFGLDGYDSPNAKSFMRKFRPASLRFTHGVWSNWYDWELDKPVVRDDYDFGEFDDIIRENARFDWTYGFRGLKELHDEQGFDVLFTFSMLYDDATDKAVRRVRDYESKGFDVTHVELGNENFWRDQRSRRTETPELYLAACREMSAALKAEKPGIKLSITTSWRRGEGTGATANVDHTEYNKIIKGDGSHYDAVTLHRYINAGKGDEELTSEDVATLLTSPLTLAEDEAFVLDGAAAGKEIWLTEWGVSAGYRAVSYLGMADAYLYLFGKRDVYKYTNWFQINGTNNFFIHESVNGKFETRKRGFGVVYEMLDNTFRDSDLLDTEVITADLLPGSKAVVARAAKREGVTTVFAVNKTPQAVVFDLSVDGTPYAGVFRHDAFAFDSLTQDSIYAYEDQAFVRVKTGSGTIILPPFSINTIALGAAIDAGLGQLPYTDTITLPGTIEAEFFDAGGMNVSYYDLDMANKGGTTFRPDEGVDIVELSTTNYAVAATAREWLEYTVNIPVAGTYDFNVFYSGADAGAMIGAELNDSLDLFSGISLAATSGSDDYREMRATNVNLPVGTYTLRMNIEGGSFNLDRIEVTQLQTPYAGTNKIPGILQAEEYDLGGQNQAYYDRNAENTGNANFRTAEGVDIVTRFRGLATGFNLDGEWQEFTVEVVETAEYNFSFTYSTTRTDARIGLEVMGEAIVVDSILLSSTGSYSEYNDTTIGPVTLPAGKHVLRLKVQGSGYNLDKITILEDVEQLAFNGPHHIPGTIEAEDYDTGGLGISFNDGGEGNGDSGYRTDDVGMDQVGDDSTNYALVIRSPGEWMEYTVQVAETGTYVVEVVYSSNRGTGGAIGFELPDEGGKILLAGGELPRVGPWGIYESFQLGDTIALTAGEHVLRFNVVRPAYNLDKLVFRNSNTIIQEPYAGVISIPGIIEAENFDTGGQDLGYNDTESANIGNADFRIDEGVDIDSISGGGLGVVANAEGEWQEFTVDVTEAGPYDFQFTYAATGDGARVSVAGDDLSLLTPEIALPGTGAGNYQVVTRDYVDLPAGTYTIRVNTVGSGFILDRVTVVSSIRQLPYAGKITIPGILEAENYDFGGQGLSYQDDDPENRGGAYRMDGVDIGPGNGGFAIGYNGGGEWQEYTIVVAASDNYTLDFVYSSGRAGGGVIGLELPDEDTVLVERFDFPRTAGWGTFDTLRLDSVYLTAGTHVLRINVVSIAYNLDKVIFTGTGSVAVVQAPYDGMIILPGTIQAENYDMGGQDVSYNDSDGVNTGSADFRTEDAVDIDSLTDGGLGVAVNADGEWQEYSIEVDSTALYDFTFFYSLDSSDATISLSLVDSTVIIIGPLPLSKGIPAKALEQLVVTGVELRAGMDILRVTGDRAGFLLDRIEVTAAQPNGIRNVQLAELRVYPNPNRQGIFTLDSDYEYRVYSISGAMILKGNGRKVDLSQLARGVYLLRTPETLNRLIFR